MSLVELQDGFGAETRGLEAYSTAEAASGLGGVEP